jgi:rod shape-determining protein MreD
LRARKLASLGSGVPSYASGEPESHVVALLLGCALLAQSTLAPYLSVRGAAPPLVLLLVCWFAVRSGSLRGFAFGLLAGACEDALAWNGAPAWTFATGAIGALAGRLRGTQIAESNFWLVAGAAAAVLVRYALFAVFEQLGGRAPQLAAAHLHAVLWQSLYAALLTGILVAIVQRSSRRA